MPVASAHSSCDGSRFAFVAAFRCESSALRSDPILTRATSLSSSAEESILEPLISCKKLSDVGFYGVLRQILCR